MNMINSLFKEWSRKDDHLWFLRILCVDLFQNPLMKVIPKIISTSLFFLMVFQTVLFLQKFDAIYFIKYLAFYGASFFVVAALYAATRLSNICRETINKNFLVWTLSNASLTTKKKIFLEVLLTHIVVVGNGIVAIASGVTHMLPLPDDVDLFFPLALFEEFFPQWESFLSWVFRVSFIPIFLLIPVVFYTVVYLATFLRFQFYLLIDFLETMDEEYNPKMEKQYQEIIQRKLKIGIRRHAYLCEFIQRSRAKLSSLIFIFNVTGAILGISIFVFYFSFQGTFEGRYPRIVTLILIVLITFFHTILSGQMLEDASDELIEVLKRNNWYNWNQKNRKSYLIFLTNQKTLKLKFSENIAINYNLGVAIAKSIYSAVSVMSRLKHLDYSQ